MLTLRESLRGLLAAAADAKRRDASSFLVLADCLEELGASDLAARMRAPLPAAGWALYEVEKECFVRGLLRWEDEPVYQKAVAFEAAVTRVNLSRVPVMTTNRHIDRKEQARLLRTLLKRLSIPHVRVTTPRHSGASSVDVDLPKLPDHDWTRWPHEHGDCCKTPDGHKEETRCPACGRNAVVEDKFEALLRVAFPNHEDRSDSRTDYFDFKWSIHAAN